MTPENPLWVEENRERLVPPSVHTNGSAIHLSVIRPASAVEYVLVICAD
jgi:hypothetical protein